MTPISRREARRLGLKKYFIGQVCANGHVSERYTSNSHCCECQRHDNMGAACRCCGGPAARGAKLCGACYTMKLADNAGTGKTAWRTLANGVLVREVGDLP